MLVINLKDITCITSRCSDCLHVWKLYVNKVAIICKSVQNSEAIIQNTNVNFSKIVNNLLLATFSEHMVANISPSNRLSTHKIYLY